MASKERIRHLKKEQEKRALDLSQKKKKYLNANMKEYPVNKEIELLEFLYQTFRDQSRNNVKNLLSKRYIAVNGLCITQFNYVLYKGDVVQLSKVQLEKSNAVKQELKPKERPIKLDIIYEDDEFIVINKQNGLLSIESDTEKTVTAYKLVLEYMQRKDKFARAFQVHRIDKETSGVLMFTKTYELREAMQKNWNRLVKTREYLAVVEGVMDKKKDTIVSYLKETATHLMYDSKNPEDGLKCVTHYEVVEESLKYSLLDVKIDSGRKNQIRVAMSTMGHPIVGDDKYGKPTNPLNRLGLHATILEIRHPITGKLYTFKAKAPSVFMKPFH